MNIKYIELKTGYNDDGPAWIGNVKESKSGKTIYFNDHAFQRCSSRGVTGIGGNYYDIETGEEYWISGVKKNGCDRHWLGHGKVIIDRKVIDEYLAIIQSESLKESQFEIQDIDDVFTIERIHAILNEQSE